MAPATCVMAHMSTLNGMLGGQVKEHTDATGSKSTKQSRETLVESKEKSSFVQYKPRLSKSEVRVGVNPKLHLKESISFPVLCPLVAV